MSPVSPSGTSPSGSDPDAVHRLHDLLVRAYEDEASAQAITQRAGIAPGTLPIDQPNMRGWWWAVIEDLRKQGRLDDLVDAAIEDDGISAYHDEFTDLRESIQQMSQAGTSDLEGVEASLAPAVAFVRPQSVELNWRKIAYGVILFGAGVAGTLYGIAQIDRELLGLSLIVMSGVAIVVGLIELFSGLGSLSAPIE